jgi:hypothetical protein
MYTDQRWKCLLMSVVVVIHTDNCVDGCYGGGRKEESGGIWCYLNKNCKLL